MLVCLFTCKLVLHASSSHTKSQLCKPGNLNSRKKVRLVKWSWAESKPKESQDSTPKDCVGRVWHTNEFCRAYKQILFGWLWCHVSTHYMFLQSGKAGAVFKNGRKKAQIALKKHGKVTCRVNKAHERWWICCSNYTMMYVSLYCSYVPGVGLGHPRATWSTWANINQMVSLYTNYYLSVFYFHHIHLFPCAVDDLEFIGPPEYTGKMLHSIG